ncbi:unnamed protein product, partial [Mycena citricolor]
RKCLCITRVSFLLQIAVIKGGAGPAGAIETVTKQRSPFSVPKAVGVPHFIKTGCTQLLLSHMDALSSTRRASHLGIPQSARPHPLHRHQSATVAARPRRSSPLAGPAFSSENGEPPGDDDDARSTKGKDKASVRLSPASAPASRSPSLLSLHSLEGPQAPVPRTRRMSLVQPRPLSSILNTDAAPYPPSPRLDRTSPSAFRRKSYGPGPSPALPPSGSDNWLTAEPTPRFSRLSLGAGVVMPVRKADSAAAARHATRRRSSSATSDSRSVRSVASSVPSLGGSSVVTASSSYSPSGTMRPDTPTSLHGAAGVACPVVRAGDETPDVGAPGSAPVDRSAATKARKNVFRRWWKRVRGRD